MLKVVFAFCGFVGLFGLLCCVLLWGLGGCCDALGWGVVISDLVMGGVFGWVFMVCLCV